jgi:hypothetical protein
LEVLKNNIPAIKLYDDFGFERINTLKTFVQESRLQSNVEKPHSYVIERGSAKSVWQLESYNKNVPWDAMYQNIKNGSSLILRDKTGQKLGYILYEKSQSKEKQIVNLYQCEVLPGYHSAKNVVNLNYSFLL